MKHNSKTFEADKLKLVKPREHFDIINIGDYVRLNSGGPICLIVDKNNETITVSWKDIFDNVWEVDSPEQCFHLISVES